MLKPTKLHEDIIDDKKKRYTVRIGNCVPENAINLAYYYNKKANSDESMLVSESAKNIIDHKFVERWITKGPLQSMDDSKFLSNTPYHDNDGYSGILYKRFVNWETIVHTEKLTKKDKGTITGLSSDFSEPIDKKYFTDGLYGGFEYLMNVSYDVTSTKDVMVAGLQYDGCTSEKSVTQSSSSYSFPETMAYSKDGYSGSLHKNGPSRVDTIYSSTGSGASSATTKTVTFYGKPTASSSFPPKTKMIDGVLYTLKSSSYSNKALEKWYVVGGTTEPSNGSTKTEKDPTSGETITYTYTHGTGTFESKVKSNETKTYHSYGGGTYYGYDNRYGWWGTGPQWGYWTDTFPFCFGDYFGRECNDDYVQQGGFLQGEELWAVFHNDYDLGHDTNDRERHPTQVTITDGTTTTIRSDFYYDKEYCKTMFSSSPHYREDPRSAYDGGGCYWYNHYLNMGGKMPPTPPPGYTKEYWRNGIDNRDGYGYVDSRGNGVNETFGNTANKEKHVIGFYKYDVKTVIQEYQALYKGTSYVTTAIYESETSGSTSTSYKITQRYNNVFAKDDTKPVKVPTKYTANIDYKGVLEYTWNAYTGSAFYDGSVTKQGSIENINPVGSNLITMFPDSSGILRDEYGKKELGSENVNITNMYKDGVPLFYMCKLRYKIFDSVGPDSLGIYTGNSIKVVNPSMMTLNQNKYKYQVKLVPADITGTNPALKDLYEAYIYTSFEVTSSFKVNCLYNAYDDSPGLSTLERLKPGYVEPIYTQPFFEKGKDYKMTVADPVARKNVLTLTKNTIINDTRNKVPFNYRVKTADGQFVSNRMYAEAVNVDYAFYSEKHLFNGRNYTVSPIQEGSHMTAYDIIVRDCKSQLIDVNGLYDNKKLEDLKKKIFTVEFVKTSSSIDENRKLVNLYTPQDGTGVVSAETTADTGFADGEGGYTKKATLPGKYMVIGNKIYPAYEVMCKDAKLVTVRPPSSSETLENWYPRVDFSHFERVYTNHGMAIKLNYTMPEYDRQAYSSVYGKPYMDVENEKAIIVNERTIKIKNAPMYVKLDNSHNPTNLTVIKKDITGTPRKLRVASWSYTEGLIELYDIVSENDSIYVTYSYEELAYVYRGYYDDGGTFIDLDVNPSKYHTFLDNRFLPYERRKVYDLFNTVIYFFLRPSRISQIYQEPEENVTPPVSVTPELLNEDTIYHKFGDSLPNSKYDIAIGNVHIRQSTSLKSTVILDTRTRGGGVIESMSEQLRRELEPESDYYWDIGYWDGEPYTENSVIVVRLDRRILKTYGGRFTPQEVDKAISKWIAAGVMPIVEYVTTFTKDELPQSSLTITYEHTNKLEYKPSMFIGTVEI